MAFTEVAGLTIQTSSYSASTGDDVIMMNCSANLTVTLPSAALCPGKRMEIKRIDANANLYTLSILTTLSQTVDLRASGSVMLQPNDYAILISDGSNWKSIALLETVNARYTFSTTQTVSASVPVLINFDTKGYDSHNLASGLGTGWRYTANSSGKFSIKTSLHFSTGAAGQYPQIFIYKNGAQYSGGIKIVIAGSGVDQILNVGDDVSLLAGDYVQIFMGAMNGSILTDALGNYVAIAKISN